MWRPAPDHAPSNPLSTPLSPFPPKPPPTTASTWHPKRTSQGEHADAAQEARKKGIEWEGAHNDTVDELEYARHQNEGQEEVHDFGLSGRALLVLGDQALAYALDIHGRDGGHHASLVVM